MKLFLLTISCSLLLFSCDPGYSVILYNRSYTSKQIQVIRTQYYKKSAIAMDDSLLLKDIFDSKISNTLTKQKIPVLKDTTNNSFSFILKENKGVVIENGMGWPDFKQKVILNKNDTIFLKTDKRVIVKKKWMYSVTSIYVD